MATLGKRAIKKQQFLAKQFMLELFVDSVVFPAYWTMEEILSLHSLLWDESLKILRETDNSKAAIKRKLDVLEWIFADDLEVSRKGNGEVKISYISEKPLSFYVCSKLEGYDPDRIREKIFQNLDSRWQSMLQKAKAA